MGERCVFQKTKKTYTWERFVGRIVSMRFIQYENVKGQLLFFFLSFLKEFLFSVLQPSWKYSPKYWLLAGAFKSLPHSSCSSLQNINLWILSVCLLLVTCLSNSFSRTQGNLPKGPHWTVIPTGTSWQMSHLRTQRTCEPVKDLTPVFKRGIFWINDWYGRTQSIVHGANPGLVVLVL